MCPPKQEPDWLIEIVSYIKWIRQGLPDDVEFEFIVKIDGSIEYRFIIV